MTHSLVMPAQAGIQSTCPLVQEHEERCDGFPLSRERRKNEAGIMESADPMQGRADVACKAEVA